MLRHPLDDALRTSEEPPRAAFLAGVTRLLPRPFTSQSRVKGERGRVQVRRRPTVSALSGPVSIRRVDHHAFLTPPHRTGHAVRLHPAPGRVSHSGMRRWPKMKAPEQQHPPRPEDVFGGEVPPPSARALVPPPQEIAH